MSRKDRTSPSGPATGEKQTIAVNFGTVGLNTSTTVAAAVTGITTFDTVSITVKDSILDGVNIGAPFITTAGSISIRAANCNTVNLTLNTVTMDITIHKYKS